VAEGEFWATKVALLITKAALLITNGLRYRLVGHNNLKFLTSQSPPENPARNQNLPGIEPFLCIFRIVQEPDLQCRKIILYY